MDLERFIELLTLSKITTEQQSVDLLYRFEDERKEFANGEDAINQFCDFLIGTGSVTEWQCEKLKMARWKGFYLECYLMLEQVGKDKTTCSYKARDVRDGKSVVLVITPTPLSKSGQIEYRVEPFSG